MSPEGTLIEGARRRFAETDTEVLRELWSTDGRTDWAEAALRDELIERGERPEALDLIAARRAEIATNAPPSSRELIWNYGVAGRIMTMAAVFAWCVIERALVGSTILAWLGSTAIMGVYAYVLTLRTSAQSQYSTGGTTRFVGGWQLLLAWAFVVIGAIGTLASIFS
jgi:hypothetical protein